MTANTLIAALALPPDSLVSQRVPKKLLIEQGMPTAADKRQINDGIEEIQWVAALKPTSVGVPIYRDETREYLEIAVLAASFRPPAKTPRIVELIHRAIPYPVALITSLAQTLTFSVAHKRWSQGQARKMVLDDTVQTAVLAGTPEEQPFLASLAVSTLPRQNLYAFYGRWLESITALSAARLTGSFTVAETPAATADRRAALEEHARLQRELTALRAAATKEKQLNRRVEINLTIKDLEARLANVAARL